jgi:hypothetical protein
MATQHGYRRFARFVPAAIGAALFLVMAIGSTVSVGAAVPANVFTAHGCGGPLGSMGNYDCPGITPYGYVAGYGQLPAGGTWVGNRYYYRDNRYCGDGNLFFQNGGYFCANGVPATGYVLPAVAVPVSYVGVPVAYYGIPAQTCADARFAWTPDRGCVWRG